MYPLTASRSGAGSRIGLYKVFSLGWFFRSWARCWQYLPAIRLFEIYANNPADTLSTMFFGALWGVGGLTFGLSMRYLGVALGQSIALGTCAGLGTILTPVFTGKAGDLTTSVIVGV